ECSRSEPGDPTTPFHPRISLPLAGRVGEGVSTSPRYFSCLGLNLPPPCGEGRGGGLDIASTFSPPTPLRRVTVGIASSHLPPRPPPPAHPPPSLPPPGGVGSPVPPSPRLLCALGLNSPPPLPPRWRRGPGIISSSHPPPPLRRVTVGISSSDLPPPLRRVTVGISSSHLPPPLRRGTGGISSSHLPPPLRARAGVGRLRHRTHGTIVRPRSAIYPLPPAPD